VTPAEVRDETMCRGRRHRRSCSSLRSCMSIVYLGAGLQGLQGLRRGCRGCSMGAGAAAWVPGLRRGCRGCCAPLGELFAEHEVAPGQKLVQA